MSLTLSANPQNNLPILNEPLFQSWGPVPSSNTYQFNTILMVDPTPLEINFLIRDIIGLPEYAGYSEFELIARQLFSPATPQWLNESCYTAQGYPNDISSSIPYENGMEFTFTPSFQNLALLSAGTYTFTHEFVIRGKDSIGFWVTLDSHSHQTILKVSNSIVEYFPEWLNFFHTQGNTLPYEEISINGTNWELRGHANFILSSTTPGVTISTEIVSGQTLYRASGTGVAVIRCTIGTFFDEQSSYTLQERISGLDVYADDVFQSAILIRVDVVTTPTLSVTPNALSFTAIKGIVEPVPIDLVILASEPPYTLTKSPWLEVTETTAEIDGIIRPVTRVSPIATSNMDAGQYDGFVKLSDTVDGELVEINIPVTYNLEGFIQSPYLQNNQAFTLDPVYFNFFTQYPDTFFQVEALIKTYSFFDSIEKVTTIFEKVPVFQGRGQLNFGQTIHRLMNKFTAPNTNYLQYKPALLSLTVKETNISDGEIIREAFIQDKPFLAGLSIGQSGNYGFLDFNKKADRVTVNSLYYLNIFVPQGSYELRVFKNGTQIDTIPLIPTNGYVVLNQISFSNFQIGDIVDYSLHVVGDANAQPPTKRFYVIPESRYSFNVVWENEFLLQTIFEFTGAAKIQAEFENRTQNTYKNFVEVMEIITNTKVNKLSMSTGWIIKDSIDTIESLLRSKKAWLLTGNNQIALRPITKSVIAEDTERELVEYLIEFQINRSYNEETYFF